MATRYTTDDVLENLFEDSIDLFEGEDSDFEGEGVYSYLAGASNEGLNALQLQEDPEEEDVSTPSSEGEENLDLRYNVFIIYLYKVYKSIKNELS